MADMTTLILHSEGATAPSGHPESAPALLRVIAWDDPLVEASGFDPRSVYVESFWLPVLGPSATWLLRRLADGLEDSPRGFDLPLEETARSLGLGGLGSRHSPFRRAILRCARYGIVHHASSDTLAVRRRLSPVPHRHVLRFPPSLRLQHDRWEKAWRCSPVLADVRRRTRALALELVTAEESPAGVERRLVQWAVHPALAHESAWWAWACHSEAATAAVPPPKDA